LSAQAGRCHVFPIFLAAAMVVAPLFLFFSILMPQEMWCNKDSGGGGGINNNCALGN